MSRMDLFHVKNKPSFVWFHKEPLTSMEQFQLFIVEKGSN